MGSLDVTRANLDTITRLTGELYPRIQATEQIIGALNAAITQLSGEQSTPVIAPLRGHLEMARASNNGLMGALQALGREVLTLRGRLGL